MKDPTDIPVRVWDEIHKGLSDLEASVVRLRFGLDGQSPQTVTDIAKTLHLGRERVRQIEANFLQRVAKLHDRRGSDGGD